MATPKSYVSSLSISNWGGSSSSGSFTFQFEGGSTNYTMDKEDVERVFGVLHEIIERKRKDIAQALMNIETPALLGYDRTKTIEADEVDDIQPPAMPF